MKKLFDSTLESLMLVGSFTLETHESELESMRVVSIADVRADAEREADEEARRSLAA